MVRKILKFYPIYIVVILGVLPLFDLFHAGLPLTHDGKDHVVRIANFYASLSEGILIPRWAENLNWGYGHPVMMFLYPLPSYFASFFHVLGFSLIDSLKIVFGVSFIFSGLGMYIWLRKLLGIEAGLLGAILYLFAPYRFVNVYVRGAIGEHVAFLFIPFILFFITQLFLDTRSSLRFLIVNFLGIALFTAGLILSHNALSILFLAFAGIYAVIIFFYNRNIMKFITLGIGVFWGFLLSSFFWIPALIEGKYTLRDIVTGDSEYALRFVETPLKFFSPEWSYGITGQLSVQIGIVHLLVIAISVIAVVKLTKKEPMKKSLYIFALFSLIFSLFMMLRESNFIWSFVSTIQKFQFPWRFLSLTVLASSLVGAYAILLVKKEKRIFGLILVVVFAVLFYGSYWRANDYLNREDLFFKSVYEGTTDTGESAPVWSVRFMEERPDAHIEILQGEVFIQEKSRSSVLHEYSIISSDSARIKENTLYFPGWNIYINNKKLNPDTEIQYQDPAHRGVMTFNIDEGESNVRVVFEDTKLRFVSNVISLISFILLGLITLIVLFSKPHARKNS